VLVLLPEIASKSIFEGVSKSRYVRKPLLVDSVLSETR
jgi:hypothetical protein